jgi:integrase/recombinase XerD
MAELQDHMDAFLKHLLLEKNYSKHTLEAYSRHLYRLADHLPSEPSALSADRLKPLLYALFKGDKSETDKSLSFQAQCLSAWKQFLNFLYHHGLTLKNQSAFLVLPRQPKSLPKTMTPEEVFALLEAPPTHKPSGLRDRALLELLYGSGARISEVLQLGLADLQWEEGTLRILGKRQKIRMVPLPERTLVWLKLYLEEVRTPLLAFPQDSGQDSGQDSRYLFLSRKGRPFSRMQAWRRIKVYALHVGIRHCSPHVLRHAFASHLVQAGADLRSVQSLLGHQSLRATQIYTRVGPKHLEDLIRTYHLLGTRIE